MSENFAYDGEKKFGFCTHGRLQIQKSTPLGFHYYLFCFLIMVISKFIQLKHFVANLSFLELFNIDYFFL